ncbi:hypothetical protein PR048_025243 [Dryococelus australis]|uniref:Uncharacterized protein n=1 Tax=Dryococelus australis TaxID=614101 RepID=A0ABQ9GQX5_9NEOP|nr:hypothetical protein PR048_025243 [Dryococelus australis]
MVHSEAGPGARAMFYRDAAGTLGGLPKSPSFHSGLDLVAAAVEGPGAPPGDSALVYSGGQLGLPRQLPLLMGEGPARS